MTWIESRGVTGEHLDLLGPLGQGQHQLEQETVQLGLRQRVGPLILHRVLGGDHHERIRQAPGLAVNGDLALLHGLQQRRLRLGWGAVDLVSQQEVGEDGAGPEGELRAAGVVDERAGDVPGHEIGGELDAFGLHVQRCGQRPHQEGLGHAGDSLEQDVPAGEQGDDQSGHGGLLADDGLAHLAAHGHQALARVGAGLPVGGRLGGLGGAVGAWGLRAPGSPQVGDAGFRITCGARLAGGVGAVHAHTE